MNELEHDRGELKRKTEFIQSELRMAHKIQMSLIPYQSPFPNIAFYYKPMEEVGGDFFDLIAFNDPNQIGIFHQRRFGTRCACGFYHFDAEKHDCADRQFYRRSGTDDDGSERYAFQSDSRELCDGFLRNL